MAVGADFRFIDQVGGHQYKRFHELLENEELFNRVAPAQKIQPLVIPKLKLIKRPLDLF
jgi:hypothetical protein